MIVLVTLVSLIAISAAAVVFYASFCRLTKTTGRVFATVRLGIWLLASTSFLAIWLPLLGWWTPDPLTAAILVAVAAHQLATRRAWLHDVPHFYLRESHR
jgi:divalent metal cation (Fe/Co/Zn/Cd) transporter